LTFLTAIDRYIFRLVLMPMLAVFVIAASLLMLDKMLRLFDFVATEGGPVSIVFKMLANLLPEYASLAIPLGLMLGILLAFRKLATSSELDVMRAVGLSYTRLLRVPYHDHDRSGDRELRHRRLSPAAGALLLRAAQFELRSGALGASIKVGEFTTLKDRMALRIEESQDDGRQLIGIFARVANDKGQVLSISAREGRFLALQNKPDTIVLRLIDGQIVQDMPGEQPARAQRFRATTCRSTCRRSNGSANAAARTANTSCPNCCASAGATPAAPRSARARGLFQLPHGRSGDDAAAAAAGGGAGDPAQAFDFGAGACSSRS
jgi:lipopolysaccharide export system permease protein